MPWTIEGFGLAQPCMIHGSESLVDLFSQFASQRGIIVAEERVAALHADKFPGNFPRLLLPSLGEGLKDQAWVQLLLNYFHSLNLSRSDWVLAVGGGAITDLVGFAASLYKRGLKTSLVPTTLLAQVDAAIGGKCGINWRGVKNLVGNFYFPNQVFCAADVLSTLPQRQLCSGMAEVYKYQLLTRGLSEFRPLKRTELPEVVEECCRYKDTLVARDPFDTGVRRVLNLGHTLAHALEGLVSDLLHGEAVAWGLDFALRVAGGRGYLDREVLDQALAVLAAMPRRRLPQLDFRQIWKKMLLDKKNLDRGVWMILPGRGKFDLYNCTRKELEQGWQQLGTWRLMEGARRGGR